MYPFQDSWSAATFDRLTLEPSKKINNANHKDGYVRKTHYNMPMRWKLKWIQIWIYVLESCKIFWDTWGFWFTIGFAVLTLVFGSEVTTIWSLSIGATMIDCLSANELDTGRQTQVNILTEQNRSNLIWTQSPPRLLVHKTNGLMVQCKQF